MSHPASSDAHQAISTSHTSPKDAAKQAPILPPISTGPEGANKTQEPSSARQVSVGGLKIEPTSPAAPGELSARSLRMHSILNPADAGQERRASLPMPMSPKTQAGPNRTLPSLGAMSSPFTSGPRPVETKDHARTNYPPPLGPLPTRSPYASAASTPLIGTPSAQRPSYGFPGPTAPGSDRRGSDSVATNPHSQTNSPTTSYSSFAPTQRNSPARHFGGGSGPAAAPSHYAQAAPQGPALVLGGDTSQRSGSSSHNTYQLMTLTTDQGSIQVPVDVQAASKVADEKRKRNAGASARFRQRRKEKERESSQTISRLESKVREVSEEKEYYRMERDYFRDLVYNSGVSAHVTPRLPSPKNRKASAAASSATGEASEWQQNGERGSDDGRNQRRRISGYREEPPRPRTASYPAPPPPAPAPHAHGYAPPPPPQYAYTRPDGRTAGAGPPSAPLPIINAHYAPHAQPYTPVWKPQVS